MSDFAPLPRLPGSLDERDTPQEEPVNPRVPQWFVTRFDEARREGFPAVCIECGHGVQEDGSGDHFDGCKLGARPAGCAETDSARDVAWVREALTLIGFRQSAECFRALDRLVARIAAEGARRQQAERAVESQWEYADQLKNVIAKRTDRYMAAERRAGQAEQALREIAETVVLDHGRGNIAYKAANRLAAIAEDALAELQSGTPEPFTATPSDSGPGGGTETEQAKEAAGSPFCSRCGGRADMQPCSVCADWPPHPGLGGGTETETQP